VRANPITPTAERVAKTAQALDRIVVRPSELLELWDEIGKAEAWVEAVRQLRGRLIA
jgi:hypothetical protein